MLSLIIIITNLIYNKLMAFKHEMDFVLVA